MKTDQSMTLRQATSGFTPAVDPLASTIRHTDQQGIHCTETTIPSQGDELPAYIAKPAQHSGPYPVVIVVQEIFGVHEHIQDICRRLAKQGYLAIAPELFFRQGDAKEYDDINALVKNLVSKVPDRQVMVDLDHTAHWASRHGGDTSKLAITGFCWGGRIAWLYAAHNPQLKAAVAWYGKLVGEKLYCYQDIRLMLPSTLAPPCWGCMVVKTVVSRKSISIPCVRHCEQQMLMPKSLFIQMQGMPLTLITAQATTKNRHWMAGSACLIGLRSTESQRILLTKMINNSHKKGARYAPKVSQHRVNRY